MLAAWNFIKEAGFVLACLVLFIAVSGPSRPVRTEENRSGRRLVCSGKTNAPRTPVGVGPIEDPAGR